MISKVFRMSKGKWFYGVELIIDTLIIALSYFIGFKIQRPDLFPAMTMDVFVTIIFISLISIVLFLIFKTHKFGKKMYMQGMFDLIVALILIAILIVSLDFLIKGIGVWRRTVFYAFGIQIIIFLVYKYFIIKLHLHIIKPIECIIVGKDLNEATRVAIKLMNSQGHLYTLKYIFTAKTIGLYDRLIDAGQVFICSSCTIDMKRDLIKYCALNNIDCSMIPSISDIIIHSSKPGNINDMIIFNMTVKMDIESKLAKRIVDLVVAIVGIVITFPIMLMVYLLIFLQDRKKSIYSQKRLSKNDQEYIMYKFRTMIENAEKDTGAILALQNDARITKLGKALRASRIDELPQLFNVLKGEMSIVGPRPERPALAKNIIDKLPEFRYRTLVKPGLTGYAQVIGRYDTEFKDKLLLDLYYINNYSLLLDFRIMFATIRILFRPSVTKGVSDEAKPKIETIIKRHKYDITHEEDHIVFSKKQPQ